MAMRAGHVAGLLLLAVLPCASACQDISKVDCPLAMRLSYDSLSLRVGQTDTVTARWALIAACRPSTWVIEWKSEAQAIALVSSVSDTSAAVTGITSGRTHVTAVPRGHPDLFESMIVIVQRD